MPITEIPKASDIQRLLKEVLRSANGHWGKMAVIAFFIVIAQACNIMNSFLVSRFAGALANTPAGLSSKELFYLFVLPIPTVALFGWICWRLTGVMASYIIPAVAHDLRLRAFDQISRHSYRFFSDNFAGSLLTRGRALEGACRETWDIIWWTVCPIVISFSVSTYLLYKKSPWLGLMCVVWFCLFVGMSLAVSRLKLKYDKPRAAKATLLTGQFADAFTNILNIKLFNGVAYERERLGKLSLEVNKYHRKSWHVMELNVFSQNMANALFATAVMVYLFTLWQKNQLSVSDFVFIQGMMLGLFNVTQQVGHSLRRLYEASAEAKEILDIIELDSEIVNARGAKALKVKTGEITFEGVGFKYHDKDVLSEINLRIQPGEKVALVGPSGAGKSTVTKLVLRFFDVDRGKITIDNQNIAKVTQESLRDAIALVPQDSVLFHRSLKENIRYGNRDASDEEVIEAAKKAHCHEFITKLPQGYETLVGERGVKLSGGERQRVAIARAILKNAPILILDEATSALDSESEHLIQDALRNLMKDKTVIVIAHRLSTIMDMDRIIVMEDGRVTDQGTHQELTSKVGKYQDLWHIQAGGFAKA